MTLQEFVELSKASGVRACARAARVADGRLCMLFERGVSVLFFLGAAHGFRGLGPECNPHGKCLSACFLRACWSKTSWCDPSGCLSVWSLVFRGWDVLRRCAQPWRCRMTQAFTEKSLDFQQKIIDRSGLGDETYLPDGSPLVGLCMQQCIGLRRGCLT